MKLDLKWAIDGEETSEREVAVVADIIRASTTIITAFSFGAREIIPLQSIEEARKYGPAAMLMGEDRTGGKPEGFDFGNTPSKFDSRLAGKTIAFSSNNFPKALAAAKKSLHVLIGALVNASATCEKAYSLALENNLDICLMLAGQKIEPHATEEMVFAGMCGERLKGRCELSERIAGAIGFSEKINFDIRKGKHAQEHLKDGIFVDVEFANQKDIFNIVPAFKDGRIALWA